MMLCKNCGAELNANARFCHKCGAKVTVEFKPSSDDDKNPEETKQGYENVKDETLTEGPVKQEDPTAEPTGSGSTGDPTSPQPTELPDPQVQFNGAPVQPMGGPDPQVPFNGVPVQPMGGPNPQGPFNGVPVQPMGGPNPQGPFNGPPVQPMGGPDPHVPFNGVPVQPMGGPNPQGPFNGPPQPPYTGPYGPAGMPPYNNNGKKTGKKKILLPILLIAIGVVAALALIYFFVPGVKENVSRLFGGKANVETSAVNSAEAGKKETSNKDSGKEESSASSATSATSSAENNVFTGPKKPVNIQIRQVDNTKFPEVTLYANIFDEADKVVEDIKLENLNVKEINKDGQIVNATINDVYRILDKDRININLVMDQSDSMNSYNRMQQAKNAAKGLVDKMELGHGDQVEVITFDSHVYLKQEFTSEKNLLYNSIDNIAPYGMTALLDALYAGLYQTNMETGAKCVIGFTDGMENSSSYSYDDVVYLSRNTGIPVYIIGIGDAYDASSLQRLASDCSGRYYSAANTNLESILEDIYLKIYREQQDYYVVRYMAADTSNIHDFRKVVLETTDTSPYEGTYTKEYVPEADVAGAFGDYFNKDFIIPESSARPVTDADLAGLSLAELRIARNEIYARHGRQFKDPLLNQWFYSKAWYLNVGRKYTPDEFESMDPYLLNTLELQNATYIFAYEQDKMEREDIYPQAANKELSEYDLALTKPVLRQALSQLNSYPSTAVLEKNKQMIEAALAKDEVSY